MGTPKKGGIYFERELYQSEAFLSLGKNGMKVLIAILDNRKRESQSKARDRKGNRRQSQFVNLDRLEIPYGTLVKVYKVNRSSIPAAFDDLLAKGFITLVYHGGGFKHDKNRYAWSNNWMIWKPGVSPFSTRPTREKHGYQGRRIGATKERDVGKEIAPPRPSQEATGKSFDLKAATGCDTWDAYLRYARGKSLSTFDVWVEKQILAGVWSHAPDHLIQKLLKRYQRLYGKECEMWTKGGVL